MPVRRRTHYGAFSGGGAAAFSPLSLSPVAWYDPSDLTTMFQNSNGTTAVAADGDPVGYIADKSGNGRHWIQATASRRPLYKTSGGLSWLLMDGVDDGLGLSPATLAVNLTAVMGLDRGTDTAALLLVGDSIIAGTKFIGVIQASVSDSFLGAGTPTFRVNGAAIGGSRQNLLDALTASTAKVFTAEAVNMSAWTALFTCNYQSFEFGGKIYGVVICPALSAAQRANLESYMAGQMGITL